MTNLTNSVHSVSSINDKLSKCQIAMGNKSNLLHSFSSHASLVNPLLPLATSVIFDSDGIRGHSKYEILYILIIFINCFVIVVADLFYNL